jgi:hypothetical protein
MSESFKQMKMVSPELLKERVETIKDFFQNDMEAYEVIRDRETDEHYLHYAYLHINLAEGAAKEVFHHVLPLESTDVVALIYGEQEYSYPDHWKTSYLRSGPDGALVWFHPPQVSEGGEDEQVGKVLQHKLSNFRAEGSFDDESLKKLFAEIEKMLDKNHD